MKSAVWKHIEGTTIGKTILDLMLEQPNGTENPESIQCEQFNSR